MRTMEFLPRKSHQSLWGLYIFVICISGPHPEDSLSWFSPQKQISKRDYVNKIVADSINTVYCDNGHTCFSLVLDTPASLSHPPTCIVLEAKQKQLKKENFAGGFLLT